MDWLQTFDQETSHQDHDNFTMFILFSVPGSFNEYYPVHEYFSDTTEVFQVSFRRMLP